MRLPTAIQGPVYVASGLWPVVHLRSFEKLTGPKVDGWLVKTVGGLLAVIGSSLIAGGAVRGPSRAMRVLGLGSAAVLALVDVVYASRGRISKIYFADAALQIAIGAAWLAADCEVVRGLDARSVLRSHGAAVTEGVRPCGRDETRP